MARQSPGSTHATHSTQGNKMPIAAPDQNTRRRKPKALIRTQAELIEAAKAAGLQVKSDVCGHTTIVLNRSRGVRIWADKVIHDLHVDSAVAARINISDAAKLLRLL